MLAQCVAQQHCSERASAPVTEAPQIGAAVPLASLRGFTLTQIDELIGLRSVRALSPMQVTFESAEDDPASLLVQTGSAQDARQLEGQCAVQLQCSLQQPLQHPPIRQHRSLPQPPLQSPLPQPPLPRRRLPALAGSDDPTPLSLLTQALPPSLLVSEFEHKQHACEADACDVEVSELLHAHTDRARELLPTSHFPSASSMCSSTKLLSASPPVQAPLTLVDPPAEPQPKQLLSQSRPPANATRLPKATPVVTSTSVTPPVPARTVPSPIIQPNESGEVNLYRSSSLEHSADCLDGTPLAATTRELAPSVEPPRRLLEEAALERSSSFDPSPPDAP